MNIHSTTYRWSPPRPSRATRKIPRSSHGHFVGEFVCPVHGASSAADAQRVGFESKLESDAMICARYRPGVVDVQEQIEPVLVAYGNRTKLHTLDFRAIYASGLRFGAAVKPANKATDEFRALIEHVARAAIPRLVDRVAIITEASIHPVTLFNSRLLHAGAVHHDPEKDHALLGALKRVEGPVTIQDISARAGLYADGLYTVARAIARGVLACNRTEKIGQQTYVQIASKGIGS